MLMIYDYRVTVSLEDSPQRTDAFDHAIVADTSDNCSAILRHSLECVKGRTPNEGVSSVRPRSYVARDQPDYWHRAERPSRTWNSTGATHRTPSDRFLDSMASPNPVISRGGPNGLQRPG
jgi:hypothetical protein